MPTGPVLPTLEGMWESLSARWSALADPVRRRIEAKCAAHGLVYPWWIPVTSTVGGVVVVTLALATRDALWPPTPLALTLLLVTLPAVIVFGTDVWLPPPVEAFAALGATALLLASPVTNGTADVAPALLVLATAEAVSTSGVLVGVTTGALSLALIGVAGPLWGLEDQPIHVLIVLLGLLAGAMLRTQMRALIAEQSARARDQERATLAERQRIAREIHDLVAHSLSVTLLHITGARHALQDADSDEEVEEALAEAERVGREAMADIRRTVSTLADAPAELHPLPGAADIPDLVQQLHQAGMPVEYDASGDPSALPAAAGLGFYRIAQESLANVARHAPGMLARVELATTPTETSLVIRNALPEKQLRPDGAGHGVLGMEARAAQLGAVLTAGRDGQDWRVEVRLPLDPATSERHCRVVRALTGEAEA